MSIKEKLQQINPRDEQGIFRDPERRKSLDLWVTFAIIVLVGTGSFGLGRLSRIESNQSPVRVEQIDIFNNAQGAGAAGALPDDREAVSATPAAGEVVGSQNSDKYHYPWCSGAQRIKESNKIVFDSIEAARAAGYLPAGNCPGLE